MAPFSVLLQYIYPQHLLSRITGLLAHCRLKLFKNWAIKRLIRLHKVNLSEAISSDLNDYPHFNSFFTRYLKPELRPIAPEPNQLASPVDGTLSQIGMLTEHSLIQAKQFNYSVLSLLGGSTDWAAHFRGGHFATIYLAPGDYHRVHIPCDGRLLETIYVPGRLFSVNPLTTAHVPGLFTRNERLICLFESVAGPMAVILVGAMLVGHIQTVWSCNPCSNRIKTTRFPTPIPFNKGGEIGHFLMGSTVILLFGKDKITWQASLQAATQVRLGELIGTLR